MGGSVEKLWKKATPVGMMYEALKDKDEPTAVAPTTPAITQADVDAAITKSRDEDNRKREELRTGRKAKGEGTAVTAVRI